MFKVKLRLEQGIFSSCHGHSSLESCSAAFPPSPVMQTLLLTANLQTVSVLTQSNGCSQFDALLAGLQINLGRHTMPSCLTAAWKKNIETVLAIHKRQRLRVPLTLLPALSIHGRHLLARINYQHL